VPALTDSDRNRIVVPDRQPHGEDLGEVTKFGDENHREAGGRDPSEPRTAPAHTDVVIPVAPSSPQEQQCAGQEQDGDHHLHRPVGQRVSRQPTATAKATWSAKAAATPAKTNPGRYRLPGIKLANAVLPASSAGRSNAKTAAATARLTGELVTS